MTSVSVSNLNTSRAGGHIASFRPPVTAFCGGPTRTDAKPFSPGIDIRAWEAELQDYFVAEGITQDLVKISEAKRAIAPNKGDARYVVASSPTLRNATDYAAFMKELKELYVPESQTDPVGLAVEVIETRWEMGGTFRSYLAELNEALTRVGAAAEAKYGMSWHEETARVMAFGAVARRLEIEDRATLAEKAKPSQPIIRGLSKIFASKGGPSPNKACKEKVQYAQRALYSQCAATPPKRVEVSSREYRAASKPNPRPRVPAGPSGPPREPRRVATRPQTPPVKRQGVSEKCWACRQPGHRALQCPHYGYQECWHCKEEGHIARHCPRRKRYGYPEPTRRSDTPQQQWDFRSSPPDGRRYDLRRTYSCENTTREFPSLREAYPSRHEGRNGGLPEHPDGAGEGYRSRRGSY